MRHRLPAACLALAFAAASPALPMTGCSGEPAARRPDGVVLVVLDTLRADRLSAYGAARDTSPVFDALAARGVLFEQAMSVAPWTLPAMIGLLSGSFPSAEQWADDRFPGTAVERLRLRGVATAAFTEGGFVSERFGFARGFEVHEERQSSVRLVEGGASRETESGDVATTFDAAIAWLESNDRTPFFVLVHTYETHTPYERLRYAEGLERGGLPHATFGTEGQTLVRSGALPVGDVERRYVRALYDGGVRTADRHLGRLLEALERLGLASRTAVIVTSDHGEDLGERDPRRLGDHGHSLRDELLRVPLVVYDPTLDAPPARVATQVRSIDVMPTIFERLGLGAPEAMGGRSLVPLMRGRPAEDRRAFARVTRKGRPRASLRDGRYKLIVDLQGARPPRLFDLEQDPGETTACTEAEPETAATLGEALDAFLEDLDARGPLDFSMPTENLPPALLEQLRQLGYLE